ncbi:hypothetical protein Dip510_001304 [Elusimicrobium posterum]|uniref:hypothetical protein n=1 Tax=Elusimicrobium posterum TaxID=3116653 RepID=UPI003C73BF4A
MAETFLIDVPEYGEKELQQIWGTKENWYTKDAWLEIAGAADIERKIRKTDELFLANIASLKLAAPDGKRGEMALKLRKEAECAVKGDCLTESEIEKVTTAAVPELFNQYNLLSGIYEDDAVSKRKNIDLVLAPGGKIREIIELKQRDNTKNPLYAVLQIVYYYKILKKLRDMGYTKDKGFDTDCETPLTLRVLMPEEYFVNFGDKKAADTICSLLYNRLFVYAKFSIFSQAKVESIVKNAADKDERNTLIREYFAAVMAGRA